MNKYHFKVSTALGIKDNITGEDATCILVDGDSVLCTFHGTNAKFQAQLVCIALNYSSPALIDILLS